MEDEQYSHRDFNNVQIEGEIKVVISHAEEFNVRLTGKEVYTRKVDIVQTGENLTISSDLENPRSPIRLFITMPYLKSLGLDRTDDVKVVGFVQPEMQIKSTSDHDLKAIVNVENLTLHQRGRTEFDLRGSGKFLKATLYDRSRLDAEHYAIDVAEVSTNNYSKASVAVADTLRKDISGDSRIEVDGDPKVVIDSQ